MSAYKVLAPYVTLNVTDGNGQEVVTGFYEGAVVDNAVEGEVLDRHVRKGMVEKATGSSSQKDSPTQAKKTAASDKS